MIRVFEFYTNDEVLGHVRVDTESNEVMADPEDLLPVFMTPRPWDMEQRMAHFADQSNAYVHSREIPV